MTMLHDQASSLNHGSIEGARVFAGLQLLNDQQDLLAV